MNHFVSTQTSSKQPLNGNASTPSVGHCCPAGSAYVDGMGCLETNACNEECPPKGGSAVQGECYTAKSA